MPRIARKTAPAARAGSEPSAVPHQALDQSSAIYSRPALVSIVCPAYNEADGITEFVRRVSGVMDSMAIPYEVVLVNDGSTDDTHREMTALAGRHSELTIVSLTRNFGKEVALTAGLQHAMGDVVVILDADLQDPPELIPAFVARYMEGFDVVYGRRTNRAGESWLKTFTARLFYRAMSGVGPVRLPENVGDFRLISRRVNLALLSLPERHRFMKGLFAWVGYPASAIDYDRQRRFADRSKWSYPRLVGLSVEGITSFTIVPLRVVSILGLVISLIAFAYGGYVFVRTLIFGDSVAGFPTLLLTMLLLGGMELIALGVIGEYLGRVFNEVKGRPLFLVESVSWSLAGGARHMGQSGAEHA